MINGPFWWFQEVVSCFIMLIVVSCFFSSWINKINLRSLKKELQHLITSFVFTMHQWKNRFRGQVAAGDCRFDISG